MSAESHVTIIKNRVTVVYGYVTVVHFRVSQAERENGALCPDGAVEKGIFEGLYPLPVRRCSLGEKDHGEALAENLRNRLNLLFES